MARVPNSVRKASEKADKIHKEVYGNKEEGDDKGTPPKVEDPPKKAPEVEPEPAPEPAPVAAAPAIADPNEVDYEHKYRVIQGKYDKEVPELRNHVGELSKEVKRLTESMASQPSGGDDSPSSFDEEIAKINAAYGEELTSFINSMASSKATEIANRIVDEKFGEMNEKVDNVVTNNAETQHSRFLATLDESLEGWRVLNRDQKFINWLDQLIDPEIGTETYKERLNMAVQAADSSKALAIFNRYMKSNPESLADEKRNSELEELVTPVGQGGAEGPTPDNSGKKIYGKAEIDQFYKDCRTGKYKNDPAAKAEKEQEIFAAQNEGRISG
jgi:hypothetical protein